MPGGRRAEPAFAPAPGATGTNRRLALLAAGLWGLQAAFLGPTLALLLVTIFGASAAQVGAVVAVYNASGFLASLVIPVRADRRGRYLGPLLACSCLTLGLAALMLFGTSLPVAAVALVLLGGPGGAGITLLFAYIMKGGASTSQVVNTRAMFSLAWVIGPPVATALIGWLGGRSILVVVGAFSLASVAIAGWLRARDDEAGTSPATPEEAASGSGATGWRIAVGPRVLIVSVAFVLAQATNTAAVAILTLNVSQALGLPLVWAGVCAGLAAGLEIPVLVLLGRLSDRYASRVLLFWGCVAGVAYYAGMVVARDLVGLLALQVLNAWFYATVAGIGLTIFQELIPRPGLANGIFANTGRIGSVLAGPVIAFADAPWGYPGVYAACALMLVVTAGAFAAAEVQRRGSDSAAAARRHGPTLLP